MKYTYIFLLAILGFSCKNSDSNEHDIQLKDTMSLDIPKDKKGNVTELYSRLINIRSILGGLDSLEGGYPTLELRIWFEYDRTDRNLIVIKKLKHWVAECYTYIFELRNDSVVVAKKDVWNPVPKMGWDNFIDSLKKLGILDLPDQSIVPDMFYHYNENAIHVEVAQKNSYRFYSYTAPLKHVEKFQEARKIEAIISLIEAELGFRRLQPI